MIAPLGPDFSAALGSNNSDIGLVLASYTLAAAISSLLSAYFLDRFERRIVIAVALTGLSLSTLACTLSTSLEQMVMIRAVAGLFGGPAASVAVAMIIDVVPNERRGRAMGMVMGAFSISSVLGIPIGLELSRLWGWQTPFLVIGIISLLVILLLYYCVPAMRMHLETQSKHKKMDFISLFKRKEALVTYGMTLFGMFAAFLVIPNIAIFVQYNLHYPRDEFGFLYLVGGALSFFVMRLTGKWIDQWGAILLSVVSTLMIVTIMYWGFATKEVMLPVVLIFIVFMAAMSMRNVISTSISSMIPEHHERAGFTSVNHSVSHLAATLGATVSAVLLSTDAIGNLIGMSELVYISILFALPMPLFVLYLSRYIQNKEKVTIS